jgi:hypothetical protein
MKTYSQCLFDRSLQDDADNFTASKPSKSVPAAPGPTRIRRRMFAGSVQEAGQPIGRFSSTSGVVCQFGERGKSFSV